MADDESSRPRGYYTYPPTSEVGSEPTTSSAAFASTTNSTPRPAHAQNGDSATTVPAPNMIPVDLMRTMMREMMTTLLETTTNAFTGTGQPSSSMPSTRTHGRSLEHIYLPAFDPDDRVDTVQIWCQHVDDLKRDSDLSDRETLNLARKHLRGRASEWARRNYTQLTTWQQLRATIIETFADEARYYDDLVQFMEYTSDQAGSLTEYATRKWELAKKAVGVEMTERKLVEAVISGMSDFRIRSDLLRLTPKTLPQLIQGLNSYKRKSVSKDSDIPSKRFKRNLVDDQFGVKLCHKCHKPGHVQKDCRSRMNNRDMTNKNSTLHRVDPIISCTFCNKTGHSFENCFRRANSNKKQSSDRNVNHLVVSNKRSTKVTIDEQDYSSLIDSGAECSLMRESIGDSIRGKIEYVMTTLRGIGENSSFSSIRRKTCSLSIGGVDVELEFVLVPDRYIQYDVILGENLFEIPGLQVVFTPSGTRVTRSSYTINLIQRDVDVCVGGLRLDTGVAGESLDRLTAVLGSYSDVFTTGNSVSEVTTGELSIRLKNRDKIVQRRPYRLAPVEREHVREIVDDLKKNGIVRDSNSPFASPILLVRKKDGTDRMCVDYRELNSNTVRDNYPLPLIDEHISKLVNAKYFTTLDMAAGFHQIPVAPESIEKTAFVTPDGQFEYLRMPFGLCNAPSVYQRSINNALRAHKDNCVLIYMDDVIIFSDTIDHGIYNLDRVLKSLRDSGFSVNINKCKFLKTEIEYLGRIISNGSVSPSPRKVQALIHSPVPSNVKTVRQFCGLAGYFRKFIPNFSQTMIPLYNLTKNNVKFNWTLEHDAVRDKIISCLASEPILALFDPSKPIELHSDASSAGFGAVLFQKRDSNLEVVEYFSMRTTETESRYHSYELETLAVVRAIKHFRHYLLGKRFKLVTDCNSLKASRSKKELLPRVHRWWAYLQSFDFDIEYRKGERIPHADFFSRNPVSLSISSINNIGDWLEVEQSQDPETREVIESIKNGTIDRNLATSYDIKDRMLYRIFTTRDNKTKKSLVVPKSYRWRIIQLYHDSLKHLGWEKTLEKIREQFWFPNMSRSTKRFVETCLTCKINKGQSGSRQVVLHPIDKVPIPFHTVHMDTTGKLSGSKSVKQYAVVFIDAFTKYCFIKPVNNLTATATVSCLKDLIFTFGTPKRIVCDQATSYTGKELREFCTLWSIDLHFIASGVSRANGQVERIMRVLTDCFTIVENTQKRSWKDAVGEVQLAINSTFSKSTGKTPFQLLTGCSQSPPAISALVRDVERLDLESCREQAKQRMDERAKVQKQKFDENKAKIIPFKVGDIVLFKQNPRVITKLSSKYRGPCIVTEVCDNDRYKISVHGTGNTLYVSHDNLRAASPSVGRELTQSLE